MSHLKNRFFFLLLYLLIHQVRGQDLKKLKEGDIIFQTSNSGQSKAIQLATGSKFSHCGIIVKIDNELQVVEAVQPVKVTKLAEWIKRGNNSYYEVKRMRGQNTLSIDQHAKLKIEYTKLLGLNYDIYFGWSDKEMYCSELVWKIYKRAFGREICALHELKEYNLDNATVQKILKERYGNSIPYTEKMVSPADIYNSALLQSVK